MTEHVDKLPPELADNCFNSLASTSGARILSHRDHACYELQPSLAEVSSGFHRKISGITGREKLVLLHYAADDKLSPRRFIPFLSIQMIEVLKGGHSERVHGSRHSKHELVRRRHRLRDQSGHGNVSM